MRQFMPVFKGLLVDAAGTLLCPSEPAAEVYLRIAKKYGCDLSADEVLRRYRRAYNTPWGGSTIRYVGDGRPFWRHIVTKSTGCCSEEMFEELYDYYAKGSSYELMQGAAESLQRIRNAGIKTAIVSNFDTRLWRILRELHIEQLFDAVIISAGPGAGVWVGTRVEGVYGGAGLSSAYWHLRSVECTPVAWCIS
jgi:FMN phosphatase YigB (HAD superfamily)